MRTLRVLQLSCGDGNDVSICNCSFFCCVCCSSLRMYLRMHVYLLWNCVCIFFGIVYVSSILFSLVSIFFLNGQVDIAMCLLHQNRISQFDSAWTVRDPETVCRPRRGNRKQASSAQCHKSLRVFGPDWVNHSRGLMEGVCSLVRASPTNSKTPNPKFYF